MADGGEKVIYSKTTPAQIRKQGIEALVKALDLWEWFDSCSSLIWETAITPGIGKSGSGG